MRVIARDAVKLLVEAGHERMCFILIEDGNALYKDCVRAPDRGYPGPCYGFDASTLNEDGQKEWAGSTQDESDE